MDVHRYPYASLIAAVEERLLRAGLEGEVARIEATLAVDADAHGVPSHGTLRVPLLLQGLADGRITTRPVVRETRKGAVVVLDGDRGPGRWISTRAMALALEGARAFGIGACLAVKTSHWGRAHAYAAQAALGGFAGIAMTNAVTSMAGWGSTDRVVGNNPLAIGFPGPVAEQPVVFDIAMSQAAVGKVATFRREGRPVPEGWGLDAQGQPTSDPAAILAGAVLPMGGHKGAGLALMIQLLTAALGGGLLDHELRERDASGLDSDSSKLFVALDPSAFAPPGVAQARAADTLSWLKAHGQTTDGFQAPGERGWTEYRRSLVEGVAVHSDIARALTAAGVVLPAVPGTMVPY